LINKVEVSLMITSKEKDKVIPFGLEPPTKYVRIQYVRTDDFSNGACMHGTEESVYGAGSVVPWM
jgi:hypothetical protein